MRTTTARLIFVPIFLLAAIALMGCSGGDGGSASVSLTTQESLQGTWEKRNYGRALKIKGSTVTFYDFTTETCVNAGAEALRDFTLKLDGISNDRSEFRLRDAPIGFTEQYNRLDALPVACANPDGAQPAELFEHVWHTFNEYYGFFSERNVDWLAQHDAARDQVYRGMTEFELFSALQTLLAPIDDVHVSLVTSDDTTFSPGEPKGFYQDFLAEFEAQSQIDEAGEYFSHEIGRALAIIDGNYLDGEFGQGGGPSDDFFKWGRIGDQVGYLSIGAFILQFDRTIADQLLAVEDVIDRALLDLDGTQSLIIDVRLSPGGADPIALAIANRFADTRRLAIRKIARSIHSQSDPQDIFIWPSDRVRYQSPVVVLTSGFSASATEVFALSMRALPHVTLVGETTIGALSDVLEKPLPNGWAVTLANELYLDADGIAFEGVGIVPDVPVAAFGLTERELGEDSALNAALLHLGIDLP